MRDVKAQGNALGAVRNTPPKPPTGNAVKDFASVFPNPNHLPPGFGLSSNTPRALNPKAQGRERTLGKTRFDRLRRRRYVNRLKIG